MTEQFHTVLHIDSLSFEEKMTELQGVVSVIERIKYLEMLIVTKQKGESQSVLDEIADLRESQHQLLIDMANDASYLVSGVPAYISVPLEFPPDNSDLN